MTNQTDDLLRLQQDVSRKKRLESKLAELREQRRIFDRKVIDLRVDYRIEQEDVERLEGRSLANFFYNVFGKLEGMKDKERREAYAAKVKLDAAVREMEALDVQISEITQELFSLSNCEKAYADALEQKRIAVRSSASPAAAQMLELEERMGALKTHKKEVEEAIDAGRNALSIAEGILRSLEQAENWNTWDLIGGDGIITHMAKHSHLDDAQENVERLQVQLCRFKTELADVRINSDMKVNIDGFLQFADYFFDGLFADWAVGERISQSQNAVYRVKSQIREALNKLSAMQSATEQELATLKAQLEALLIST